MKLESTVTMKEQDGKHTYCADGKEYPSVTTILDAVAYSKHLVGWANSLGMRHIRYEDELKRTSTQGTLCHEMAQAIVDPEHGQPPKITDPLMDYYVRTRIRNFQFQLDSNAGHWSTIFTEKPFVSHTHGTGGTMDWYANWYDKRTLFDFKTSSGLREKHIFQLGGYYDILLDNGEEPEQAGIILLKQDRCLINIFDIEIIKRAAEVFREIITPYYYAHAEFVRIIVTEPTIYGTGPDNQLKPTQPEAATSTSKEGASNGSSPD